MNDMDYETTFRRLVEALRETGFGWLVEEVSVEIRNGKPQPKKVQVQSLHEFTFVEDEALTTGRKPATFVESVEYTPSEKVDILLSAIDRALVAPCAMDVQAASILTDTTKRVGDSAAPVDYRFVGEGEIVDSRTSTANERLKRAELGNLLSQAINKLRGATHGTN